MHNPNFTDLHSQELVYRTSKAALNMSTVCTAMEFRNSASLKQGCVVCIDPGWVDTDMGSRGGTIQPPLKAPDVVGQILKVLEAVTVQDTGKFLRYDGEIVNW